MPLDTTTPTEKQLDPAARALRRALDNGLVSDFFVEEWIAKAVRTEYAPMMDALAALEREWMRITSDTNYSPGTCATYLTCARQLRAVLTTGLQVKP